MSPGEAFEDAIEDYHKHRTRAVVLGLIIGGMVLGLFVSVVLW